jgi:hypothetical protein
MKPIILLLISVIMLRANAQNVGMGTTTPGAPLHIKSTTAVEMVRIEGLNPYISFFNGTDYSGYLWYNANKMELGTPTGSGEPVLIAPGRVSTAYFTTAGRMGLGTASPTEKLDVNGNINLNGLLKIDGSSGLAGQVLTSNGASSPSWQSVANPLTGFQAEHAINQTIAALAQTKVNFTSENFDDGSDYNTSTSTFVVPATGVYHFDAQVTYFDADPGSYRLFLDNNTSLADGEYARTYLQASALGSVTVSLAITLKLTAGSSVLVHTWQNSGSDQTVAFRHFSGHRVY